MRTHRSEQPKVGLIAQAKSFSAIAKVMGALKSPVQVRFVLFRKCIS